MINFTDYIVLTPNAPIGVRIWYLRNKRGMTQSAVASTLHVNDETIRRWERGEYEPYPYQVDGLAKLFRVNADWLATGRSWE